MTIGRFDVWPTAQVEFEFKSRSKITQTTNRWTRTKNFSMIGSLYNLLLWMLSEIFAKSFKENLATADRFDQYLFRWVHAMPKIYICEKNIYEATHWSKFCSVMQQHCTEELNFQRQKCFNCCLWSQDGKKCRFNRTLTSQWLEKIQIDLSTQHCKDRYSFLHYLNLNYSMKCSRM